MRTQQTPEFGCLTQKMRNFPYPKWVRNTGTGWTLDEKKMSLAGMPINGLLILETTRDELNLIVRWIIWSISAS